MPDTDAKKTLTFDFNTAVAEARKDFPEETKNVTFVNLSLPDAERAIREWILSTDPAYQKELLDGSTPEDVALEIMMMPGFLLKDYASGKIFLGMAAEKSEAPAYLSDPEKERAFIFMHELGHIVAEGGMGTDAHIVLGRPGSEGYFSRLQNLNLGENVADSFSILYGLKKGWFENAADVAPISALRLRNFYYKGNFEHFSSLALDGLAVTAQDADFISLTPGEIAAIAARHAEAHALSEEELRKASLRFQTHFLKSMKKLNGDPENSDPQKAKENFGRYGIEDALDVFLNEPRNSIAYYVAHKMIAEGAKTGTLEFLDKTFNMTGEKWDRVRAELAERERTTTPKQLLAALERKKDAPKSPG